MAASNWLSHERDRVLRGHRSERVRPEIADSWWRSVRCGVAPDRPLDIQVDEAAAERPRLVRLAAPVLDRLATELRGTATSVILSDEHGRIVGRRAGERAMRAALDAVGSVPGALFAEDAVGTNGIGTVLERRRPTLVCGAEHFSAMFGALTCAGAPIFDPLSGRLVGVIDVTCRAGDTRPTMLALVEVAAADIAAAMLAAATAVEQQLLTEHLRAIKRGRRRPTVTVGAGLILANAAAARLLSLADHDLLRDVAAHADGGESLQVTLQTGPIALRLSPVRVDGHRVGTRIELDPERASPADRDACSAPAAGWDGATATGPSARRATMTGRTTAGRRATDAVRGSAQLPPLVGRSAAWRALCTAAHELTDAPIGCAVLVTGDPGSGRSAVSSAVLAATAAAAAPASDAAVRPGHEVPLILDAAAIAWQGAAEVLGPAHRALRAERPVVLRHIDCLDARDAMGLVALLDATAGTAIHRTGPLLALTAATGWPDCGPRALVDRLPWRLTVPALADRLDDVAELLGALASRHGAPGLRWTAAAVARLQAAELAGNVRQLECIVQSVVLRQRLGDVGVERLPAVPPCDIPNGLSRLARLERDAIVRALAAAGDNRNRAAAELGISRATLYRKLAAYRVDR